MTKREEDPARRLRRRHLKQLATLLANDAANGVPVAPCAYPTCFEPRVTDDCCYEHSIDGGAGGHGTFLPNDGIIDWQAVEVARNGWRQVKLSWVEFEIAGALILLDGHTHEEVRERTGVHCRGGGTRIKRMARLADALRDAA